MPVHKYRSAEDVEVVTAVRLDPDNLRQVIEWSAFCRRLCPWSAPAGVFRYRSIEEAAAARETWEAQASRPSGERYQQSVSAASARHTSSQRS